MLGPVAGWTVGHPLGGRYATGPPYISFGPRRDPAAGPRRSLRDLSRRTADIPGGLRGAWPYGKMTANEDLFTPVHKGLRAMLYDLARRMQTTDFSDAAATSALVADLEHDFAVAQTAGCVLCVLNHHAQDEEEGVFPQASKHAAQLVTELTSDHRELNRREYAIAASAHQLMQMARSEDRIQAGIQLNQAANDLFAAYFKHMNREETDLVPAMKEAFTDEQLAGMRASIMGKMPPDRLFALLGWMLPSLNATELSGLLGALKGKVPPEFMQRMVEICTNSVEPSRWASVRTRAGI
jgi:AhpD family alkylhydroperoxidase